MNTANIKAPCIYLISLCLAATALLTMGFENVEVFVTVQSALVVLCVLAYLLKYLSERLRCDILSPLLFTLGAVPLLAGSSLVLFVGLSRLVTTETMVLVSAISVLLVFFVGYSVVLSRLGRVHSLGAGSARKQYQVIALTIAVSMIVIGFIVVTLFLVLNDFV